MQTALDEEGLDNVQITGTDETALWNANNSFYKLEDDVKENMTTIGAHTYGGNDSERKTLLHTANRMIKICGCQRLPKEEELIGKDLMTAWMQ